MRWFNIQPKRTELQHKALEHALSIYNSNSEKYKNTMFCPYCGEPLVENGKQSRMESLSEHVMDPNGTPTLKDEYVCSHEYPYIENVDKEVKDSVRGCLFGALSKWSGGYEAGSSYLSEFRHYLYQIMESESTDQNTRDNIKKYLHNSYQHRHCNALNTFEAKSLVDCYKYGLPNRLRLPAWLTFNLIKLTINFSYEADYFGRVTKTWIHLGYLKKRDGEFCIVGTWPVKSIIDDLKLFHWKRSKLKRFKQDNPDKTEIYMRRLVDLYSTSYNRAWYIRFYEWIVKTTHPKDVKLIKEYLKVTIIPSKNRRSF